MLRTGSKRAAPGEPVFIPHDVENRGVATGIDQEPNPQISGTFPPPPQVIDSARAPSQGGDTGSNPVGTTRKSTGQRACPAPGRRSAPFSSRICPAADRHTSQLGPVGPGLTPSIVSATCGGREGYRQGLLDRVSRADAAPHSVLGSSARAYSSYSIAGGLAIFCRPWRCDVCRLPNDLHPTPRSTTS